MKKCSYCHVQVTPELSTCPLCQRELSNSVEEAESLTKYPTYPLKKKTKKRLIQGWIVSSVLISLISMFINYLTWNTQANFWSPIVVTSLLYIWYVGKGLLYDKNVNIVASSLWKNYLLLAILLFAIDFATGYNKWSLNYAIPFLGMTTSIVLILWSLRHKALWRDNLVYILLIDVLNIIPLLLFFLKQTTVLWPSITALIYGAITFLGFLIFLGQRLINELKKRFHY